MSTANLTNIDWSYGAHAIYNQYGKHWVLNNQYGGATASLREWSDGTVCDKVIYESSGAYYDLTPINSILLSS